MDYPLAIPGHEFQFPRDHGAHPDFRTEWWYITGWLRTGGGEELGVQVTFFRHRPRVQENNPSQFAPKQLIFAHAAIADAKRGKLHHDQRAAREGFGAAFAKEGDTDVALDGWSLKRNGSSYLANIDARSFGITLVFEQRQPLLLQGDQGLSRKGPHPNQASYYYSSPHLEVSGTVVLEGRRVQVAGRAWMDHEWSSEMLAEEAVGWDWLGVNLHDGGALMVFRLRDKAGNTHWAGGSHRNAAGRTQVIPRDSVVFTPARRWRSPRTNAEYPVAMRVRAGEIEIDLEPLMDDQELDARASTGTVYWEGAVRAKRDGLEIGLGYLELTGYHGRVRL
ncbi:MAG: lipocalin-like domain-containing protein [Burkholderiales bacterium]